MDVFSVRAELGSTTTVMWLALFSTRDADPFALGRIRLADTGQMPVAAMGHNIVIAAQTDMAGVLADGMGAGLDGNYVKAGDARVVAHTEVIGGGGSTSVTFPVAKLQSGGPFEFFCSFPGHWTVMRGPIRVG